MMLLLLLPLATFLPTIVRAADDSASSDTQLDQPFSSSFAKLGHAPCVSLFHRWGRIGCGTADRSVQVGRLTYFDGNSPSLKEPYVAVLEEYYLTAQSMETLLAHRGNWLQGILVLNATSLEDPNGKGGNKESSFSYLSPDATTPGGDGTPLANLSAAYNNNAYSWNPKGTGLLHYDLYGVPMAYVLDAEVSASLRQESLKAASGSNADSIVAEFNYYMGQDGINSLQCLSWKDSGTGEWSPKCLPLGGTSVWASAGSPPKPTSSPSSSSSSGSSSSSSKRPVVILAAGMDSTSLFHDVVPGANSAVSNILALLMAAKLVGLYVDDATLDSLSNRIVFALFQGETYGYMGSRSFLRDVAYPGFQCSSTLVRAVPRLGEKSEFACLNPLRPGVAFSSIGQITGMLTVDQVGHNLGSAVLYGHADKNNNNYGAFLINLLKYSGTSTTSVAAASYQKNNNNKYYPFPPSPYTSLLQLSGGSVGGAVLTGYDYAFTNTVPYHSHRDSARLVTFDLDMVAASATILARTILAAAYDDGTYDYTTSSTYAKNLIPELSASDETLVALSNCLLYHGDCDMLQKYASMETANEQMKTGFDAGSGQPLGTPPNYYVSIYNRYNGQPFVLVGENIYGAYSGQDFGKKNSDAFGWVPSQLESAIHGMLNDFLGRGSSMQSSSSGKAKSCTKTADCENIDYCSAYGDSPTCTGGGTCVCKRAYYHVAMDEAVVPALDKPTGYFNVSSSDTGASPLYTEPYWSSSVGVRVYRNVGPMPGVVTLVLGLALGGASMFAAFVLKVGLKKEKLY